MLHERVARKLLFKIERRKRYEENAWFYLGWRVKNSTAERVVLGIKVVDDVAHYYFWMDNAARVWLRLPFMEQSNDQAS